MLFNSFSFVYFFLSVYVLYVLLTRKWQNVLLLVASYFFYGCWDIRFLLLIGASTLVDYLCGLIIGREDLARWRKPALVFSLCANLGVLAFFKYFNFFIGNASELLTQLGMDPGQIRLDVVLPVGISFYTFQTMSYTIDVYRGTLRPVRSLLDFAVYVAFFPQLVAGPIERATHFVPQVQHKRLITIRKLREGTWLVLMGYFKKVVIADNMAPIADSVFNHPDGTGGLLCLVGVYAFALQIYGDFSGYSDIARGVSRLMGFDLMLNFRMPYFASDPSDFWRRWHISLSTWLRDYVYIPLGGNRRGPVRQYLNLIITMVLGGLWHGAAWHYIAWGIYHGLLLAGHRILHVLLPKHAFGRAPLFASIKIFCFFHLVCVGWVFFRVESLTDAPLMFGKVLTLSVLPGELPRILATAIGMAVLVLPLFVLEFLQERSGDMYIVKRKRPMVRFAVSALLLIMIALSGVTNGKEFIYFQF